MANGLSSMIAVSPRFAVHFIAHLEEGSGLTEPVEQRGGASLGATDQEQRRQQLTLAAVHSALSTHYVQWTHQKVWSIYIQLSSDSTAAALQAAVVRPTRIDCTTL